MLVSQVQTSEDAYSINLGPTELNTLRRILFNPDVLTSRAKPTSPTVIRAKGLAVARQMYKFRRKREERTAEIFGVGLFADPAWDLLLDLYIHSADGRKVSISSACLGAATAETTALRYIREFEKMGVIERHRHAEDRRVQLVCLTSSALDMMDEMCCQFAETLETALA